MLLSLCLSTFLAMAQVPGELDLFPGNTPPQAMGVVGELLWIDEQDGNCSAIYISDTGAPGCSDVTVVAWINMLGCAPSQTSFYELTALVICPGGGQLVYITSGILLPGGQALLAEPFDVPPECTAEFYLDIQGFGGRLDFSEAAVGAGEFCSP